MIRLPLLPLLLLSACGEPSDRLTDEQASAGQNAAIDAPVPIDVPPPFASAPKAPRAEYRAVGTEPGWALTVRPDIMTYQGDYGSMTIAEPTPSGFRPNPGRYAGSRLSVTIAPGPCSDGMSDRTYRHTVTVAADRQTLSGCGGGVLSERAPPAAEPTPDGNANMN